ncbi:MAG: HAD family hydrolase [Candidatus Helarchaeota archaeon]
MIKGIAFDLQFTLVHLKDFTLDKWFELFNEGFEQVMIYLKEEGFEFDERKLFLTLKRKRNKFFAITITREQKYFTDEILNETFLARGIKLNPEQFSRCVELYHAPEIAAWVPYPNVHETLQVLSKKYPLAIITNATRYVNDEILKKTEMNDFFQVSITDALKPRHEPFLRFKQILSAETPELVMVGDDIKADIEPAINLGMKTIHAYRGYEYLKHHAELSIKADKKIERFEEIVDVVEELNQ